MSKYVLSIIFIVQVSFGICSNKIDSLRQVLNSSKIADTSQVNCLNEIADVFEEKATDSCVFYASKALKLAQSINFYKGCGKAYNTIGSYYNGKGEYQLALANFIDGYKIYQKTDDKKAMSNLMNSIGNTYMGIDNTKKALESYTQSYEIAEAGSHKYMMAISSIGLGNIHLLQKDANRALFFFSRAKDIFQNLPNALYPLSVSYTLIGNALVESNKFGEAFQNFNKAVEQLKTLNNTYGIAATYQVMGEAYKKQNDLTNALDYFLKSHSIFTERKAYDDLKSLCLNISDVYKQKKNFEKSLEFYEKYNDYKDSVLNVEKNKQLLEVETKYETEKKDQQNVLLKKQNDLSNKTIKQQKVISYFIIVGLIISLLFGIFMYRVYSQKKKAHILITKQKAEVEEKQVQIEHQKQVIEVKQKEIVDSINYAKRIQYALLASKEILDENLMDHFVLFKPKDIVSGDFYWATNHNNKFYIAVCDSTGHGVPGAFMSLLNIGFLSEAIREKQISQPNDIFNYVRKRLIESIGKDEQQDGMDGILLCIDNENINNSKTRTITYASANTTPLLIRDKNIIELPKDKMPVGKGESSLNFTSYKIDYQLGDTLYLYTDGYADQFGGPKGKKLKYKQLNELLISNSALSVAEQLELLEQHFVNWRGVLEQVDDICIIGIKL